MVRILFHSLIVLDKWDSLIVVISRETPEKFNEIMLHHARANWEGVAGDGGRCHLYSYASDEFHWAIVVYHVGGEVDIGAELLALKEEERWKTNTERPTLIYEYKETTYLNVPCQITVTEDNILSCSKVILDCAKKLNKLYLDEFLKDIPSFEDTVFQVNTEPMTLREKSLQVKFLKKFHKDQKSMPAVVFSDLTTGVASIIALLNVLPANCSSVPASYKLDAPVEDVQQKAPFLQFVFGYIVGWWPGSCIIECQTSLTKYLNIFISFMKAKQNNEDYTICGFKLLDMCLGDHSYLRGMNVVPFQNVPMDTQYTSISIEPAKLGGVSSETMLLKHTVGFETHKLKDAEEQYIKEHLQQQSFQIHSDFTSLNLFSMYYFNVFVCSPK
jgi:hypothetical protein